MLTRSSLSFNTFRFFSLSLLVFSSCGGGGGTERSSERIRFVNADPENKSLVFELVYKTPVQASDELNVEVNYADASPYLEAPEGKLKVRVRELNSILPSIESDLEIKTNEIYTISVVRAAEALALTNNKETFDMRPPQSGNINLRLVNLSEDNPSVDVYLIDVSFADRVSQAIKDISPAASALAFKAYGSYLEFKPTELILVTTEAASKTKILSRKRLSFDQVGRYTSVFFSPPEGVSSSDPIITDTYQDND